MIPRLSPPFDAGDAWAVLHGWFRRGDGVAAFETAFATLIGKRHALAFPYGRSGLHALIRVMGWQKRELILPALSCAVMPNTVLGSGNIPRFVDVDSDDFNMSPQRLSAVLNRDTRAVVATHLYGFPMDLAGLEQVLRPHPEVAVIQDCALALGARYQGRPVHGEGLASLFSFSIGKHLSTVEGGMLATDDPALHQSLKKYRDTHYHPPGVARGLYQTLFFGASWLGLTPLVYGLVHFLATRTRALGFLTEYYSADQVVLPANLEECLPAPMGWLGVHQVSKGETLVDRRRAIALRYRAELDRVMGLRWPQVREGASFSHCPCLVDARDDFLCHMIQGGVHVGTEVFNYVLPDLPVFRPYAHGDYETARRLVATLALIPNHPRLTDGQVTRIIQRIAQWRSP